MRVTGGLRLDASQIPVLLEQGQRWLEVGRLREPSPRGRLVGIAAGELGAVGAGEPVQEPAGVVDAGVGAHEIEDRPGVLDTERLGWVVAAAHALRCGDGVTGSVRGSLPRTQETRTPGCCCGSDLIGSESAERLAGAEVALKAAEGLLIGATGGGGEIGLGEERCRRLAEQPVVEVSGTTGSAQDAGILAEARDGYRRR